MCLPGRVLLVGSYVPFRYGLVLGSYVLFLLGFNGRQLCAFLIVV
jgi:hypothetical protein